MMTKLANLRKKLKMRLREVADRVGVTASTVHDMEVRGIRTVNAAKRYAKAFPQMQWQDLLD